MYPLLFRNAITLLDLEMEDASQDSTHLIDGQVDKEATWQITVHPALGCFSHLFKGKLLLVIHGSHSL